MSTTSKTDSANGDRPITDEDFAQPAKEHPIDGLLRRARRINYWAAKRGRRFAQKIVAVIEDNEREAHEAAAHAERAAAAGSDTGEGNVE